MPQTGQKPFIFILVAGDFRESYQTSLQVMHNHFSLISTVSFQRKAKGVIKGLAVLPLLINLLSYEALL